MPSTLPPGPSRVGEAWTDEQKPSTALRENDRQTPCKTWPQLSRWGDQVPERFCEFNRTSSQCWPQASAGLCQAIQKLLEH